MTATRAAAVGPATVARALVGSLPVVGPRVRRGRGLPDVVLTRTTVVRRDHVAAYARVCGFAPRDTVGEVVPATYPHVLAFPLHVALTAERDFGFPALGMVHLANAVTVHRPIVVGDRLTLSVRAEGLRPHRRGTAFDVVAEARVGDETAWTGRSTYLSRGPGDETAPRPPQVEAVSPAGIPWRLRGNLGRRYARVSGDYNPIHLSAPTARLFGFRRPIAHGMWSLARCVAALESRLPPTVHVEATFRRPVLLPSTVFLGEREVGSAYDVGLFDATGRAHLLGRIAPSSPPDPGEGEAG